MPGTWFPGQVSPGSRVFNNPVIINGVATMQKGFASYPPAVTTPGTTVAGTGTSGTVTNTTGYDVMVYMSATTGMATISVGGNTLFATVAANGPVSVYVPLNQQLVLSYTGTLTWKWLAV